MSTLNDNGACSVLFVGGRGYFVSKYNPVILAQGGILRVSIAVYKEIPLPPHPLLL